MGTAPGTVNCIFCYTVCNNFLPHLTKYHKKAIESFPQTEAQAGKYFRRRK